MRNCALFFAALTACAQGVNFFSVESEAKLGAQLAEAMLRKETPTSHPQVREYVQRLVQKMPAVPIDDTGRHFQEYKVTVIVEDTPDTHGTHEPIVLPAGYVFVPESLILAARDESEFAGMLAHAMAHAIGRHATRTLTRSELAHVASSCPPVQKSVCSPAVAMLGLRREFENEADAVAVNMMSAAGFDPVGFAHYIGRTQVDQGDKILSTLPLRDARVEKMEDVITNLPVRTYSSSTEFLAIQQQLR